MEDLLLSSREHKILEKHKAKLEAKYFVNLIMPDVERRYSYSQEIVFVTVIGDDKNIRNVKNFLRRQMDKITAREERERNALVINLISDSESDSDIEAVFSENKENRPKRKKRRTDSSHPVVDLVPSSSLDVSCEVTSTTTALDESVIVLEPVVTALDFIPFISTNTTTRNVSNRNASSTITTDIIEISSDEEDQVELVPQPVPQSPKRLRPVVIDGSNVARSHGKAKNTFSCLGIKLCVDYFLKKGHTQVTAFVPLFRRHCKKGPILTTDQDILEELEKTQHVVFTPSRRVEGKTYTCYDDRFIVELAVENGGVILSNDNYKDLLDVSADFKETIVKRLLMYCFVGDKLMVPKDPLGSKGPTLDEFLSFPPETV